MVRFIDRFRARRSMRLAGECNTCGQCCRYLTLVDRGRPVTSRAQFERLVRDQPEYAIFRPLGERDADGFLCFACSLLGEDGRCRDYVHRPALCRAYPDPAMFRYGAKLPLRCGYYLDTQLDFAAHLERERNKYRGLRGRLGRLWGRLRRRLQTV